MSLPGPSSVEDGSRGSSAGGDAARELQAAKAEPKNQDSFARDDETGLFCVADGLGGHRGGEEASRQVVTRSCELMVEYRGDEELTPEKRLKGVIQQVAIELHQRASSSRELQSMSTTLSLLEIEGGAFRAIHVGDSRVYQWRGRRLEQLTDDHSLAFEQYQAGAIAKEDLADHPNQQFLTRAISGNKSFVIADYFEGEVQSGDVFLLCSDGVNKLVSDAALAELLDDHFGKTTGDPQEFIADLEEKTRAQGLCDDTTAVVVIVR